MAKKIDLDKKMVAVRLSKEARELMTALGLKNGMNGTAVVEQAIRRWAKEERVQANQQEQAV